VTDPIDELRTVVAAAPAPPAPMDAYLQMVRTRAYAVDDGDVELLKAAGLTEDTIFEQTVVTAISEGLRRLDRSLEAIG
jgi:alkylhydroperoxidase family enzyme